MTKKSLRHINAILTEPERVSVSWSDVKRLLGALGARVREGNSSRARIELNGVRAVFQMPRDSKVLSKFTLIALQRLLRDARINPNEI